MVIPIGVNFVEFVQKARGKKIKVSSRYEGVVVAKANDNKDFAWRAQTVIKGKVKYAGYFPFTEEGEYTAYQAAKRLKENSK